MSEMCFGGKDQWLRRGDYGIPSSQRAVTQNGLKAADQAPDPSHLCQRISLKYPVLYLQLFQFHVLQRAGRTLPLINQWDRLHTLFLMKDATMKGREWLLLRLSHSFPLKDLMDSLRYKNGPAVHYVIEPYALLLFTNTSPNLTGPEVNLR